MVFQGSQDGEMVLARLERADHQQEGRLGNGRLDGRGLDEAGVRARVGDLDPVP